MKQWRVAGINFDHMHMGDLLRMTFEHPNAEIVGVCDEQPERMKSAIDNFKITTDLVFTDYRKCIETSRPDLVILCPATAHHGDWGEKVLSHGVNVLMEKPFAATLGGADRMIAAAKQTGKMLAINWPLRWYPSHVTAKRLIDEGVISEVVEVHYYDGNRGPVRHVADKEIVPEQIASAQKAESWWYKKSFGGG